MRRAAIVLTALVAGGFAAPGDGPIGAVLGRFVLTVAAVLLGSVAGPAARIVAAGVVAVVAGTAPAVALPAFGALAVAVLGRGDRVSGAIVGAGVANAAVRLTWPDAYGATALLAAVAVLVLVVSGLRALPSRSRRAVVVGSVAVAALPVVGALAFALVVFDQRDEIAQAASAADAAIAATRDGETDEAAHQFEVAATVLGGARGALDEWWMRPVRELPVVAEQADAVDALLAATDRLSQEGARVAALVDLADLTPRRGRVDVERLRGYGTPLAHLLDEVVLAAQATRRSSWLAPPLRTRADDLRMRLSDAADELLLARDVVHRVPDLLGADGARRWYLAVLNPAELRGGGGLLGQVGVITADRGALELTSIAAVASLTRPEGFDVSVDPEYDARYLDDDFFRVERYPGNGFESPHLPSSALVARQHAAQLGLGPIDGVIAVDPIAMAGLLRLTGPIDVPGWPVPIDEANAARVLLHEQYLPEDLTGRRDFVVAVAETLFDALVGSGIGSPAELVSTMAPLVAGGHLQLHAFDDEEQDFFERHRLGHPLVRPTVDGLAVVSRDSHESKLDWFLRRTVSYDLDVDPRTGEADGTVRITLTNTAPTSGLPDNGYLGDRYGVGVIRETVSLFTPLRSASVLENGRRVPFRASRERGYETYDEIVTMAPGETATLEWHVSGALPLGADGAYRLDVHRQPTVVSDELTVRVNGEVLHDGPLERALVLRADL
ncbi:MAG TPA: DUF4012 domain-containing protein [Acidimicrobiales bacterium]|nr:DUF4012 domain-containing protein [Acidimicrobiales bacterium]